MAVCQSCARSNKPRKFVSNQYCEVCGFGFLMGPNGELSDVTCLRFATYQQAVDAGVISGVKSVPGAKPITTAAKYGAPAITEAKPEKAPATPKVSEIGERILQALREDGILGKADIQEITGLNDDEYASGIKELTKLGRIRAQGAGRGTKYEIVS